jgi:hypothetical protein
VASSPGCSSYHRPLPKTRLGIKHSRWIWRFFAAGRLPRCSIRGDQHWQTPALTATAALQDFRTLPIVERPTPNPGGCCRKSNCSRCKIISSPTKTATGDPKAFDPRKCHFRLFDLGDEREVSKKQKLPALRASFTIFLKVDADYFLRIRFLSLQPLCL